MAELTFTTNGGAAVTKATDKLSSEMSRLGKLAQDIEKRYASAFTVYKQKIADATKALEKHTDREKLLRAETTRLTIEFLKQADAGTRTHAQAELQLRRQASLQKAVAAEVAKLPPLYSQSELQLRKITPAMEKISGSAEAWEHSIHEGGKNSEAAFGAKAQKNIENFGLKLLGLLGPLAVVNKGLGEIKKRISGAQQTVAGTAASEGSLRQWGKTQEEGDRLLGMVDELQEQGAVGSRQEALDLVQSLASAGRTSPEDFQLFSQLGQRQFDPNLPGMVKSAQSISTSFGEKEVGGFRKLIQKASFGSERSPGTMAEYLDAVAGVGVAAKFENLRDEEILAATAIVAEAAGNPQEASTQLQSLVYATSGLPELSELPLGQRIEKIKSRQLGATGLSKILEVSEEAIAAASTPTMSGGWRQKPDGEWARETDKDRRGRLELQSRIDELRRRPLKSAELLKLLGRKEAAGAYGVLASEEGQAKYAADLEKIEAGNWDAGALNSRLAIKLPLSDSSRVAQKAALLLERQNLVQGAAEGMLQQARDRRRAESSASVRKSLGGGLLGGIGAAIDEGVVSSGQWLGSFREPMESLRDAEQKGHLTKEESAELRQLERMARTIEKQLEETKKQTVEIKELKNSVRGGMIAGKR